MNPEVRYTVEKQAELVAREASLVEDREFKPAPRAVDGRTDLRQGCQQNDL